MRCLERRRGDVSRGWTLVDCSVALGHRQSSGKHLPAAPALSHGFGGEGVAMVLDISGVASRYEMRYIRIDLSRDLKGERREKREEKDACGREWRCRGRGLPKNTGYRCLVYRHGHR
jgi:hypothetical protein